jgi:hypothetical protein
MLVYQHVVFLRLATSRASGGRELWWQSDKVILSRFRAGGDSLCHINMDQPQEKSGTSALLIPRPEVRPCRPRAARRQSTPAFLTRINAAKD